MTKQESPDATRPGTGQPNLRWTWESIEEALRGLQFGSIVLHVQDGVVDAGITGANLVFESEADVVTVAELGFARCTLEAAVPVDAEPAALPELEGLRVATAYPTSTRRCLDELGVKVELVPISGSVEAAPRLGLADAQRQSSQAVQRTAPLACLIYDLIRRWYASAVAAHATPAGSERPW